VLNCDSSTSKASSVSIGAIAEALPLVAVVNCLFSELSFSISRVPLFGHEAKRKIRIFCVSCRSAMNFARELLFAGRRRNSGSDCRSAFATTNSDGGMPGRMVRSQDPKESQNKLGCNDGKKLEQSLGNNSGPDEGMISAHFAFTRLR
jgi:hypothetical protein